MEKFSILALLIKTAGIAMHMLMRISSALDLVNLKPEFSQQKDHVAASSKKLYKPTQYGRTKHVEFEMLY